MSNDASVTAEEIKSCLFALCPYNATEVEVGSSNIAEI